MKREGIRGNLGEYFLIFSLHDVLSERTVALTELLCHADERLVFSLSPSELAVHDYSGLVKTQSQIVMTYTIHVPEFSNKKKQKQYPPKKTHEEQIEN